MVKYKYAIIFFLYQNTCTASDAMFRRNIADLSLWDTTNNFPLMGTWSIDPSIDFSCLLG